MARTRAQRRDYYEALGVTRDADGEEIKRAFHALAREVHPDVSSAPEAEERFVELAEAYSVLANTERRVLYDRFGVRGRSTGFSHRLMDAAFQETATLGNDLVAELKLGHYEAERGTTRTVRLVGEATCRRCEGLGRTGKLRFCPSCDGTGRQKRVSESESGRLLQVERCMPCAGSGRTGGKMCSGCDGDGRIEVKRTLRVRIPAGVEDGQTVRIRGEGLPPTNGGPPGDAFLVVRVLEPPREHVVLRTLTLVGLALSIALLLKLLFF